MDEIVDVIVVEDDPRMRERLEVALAASERIRVRDWAMTAAAGIAALEAQEPDVLLVDLGLPDASGITAVSYTHLTLPTICSV